jgi:hypothetical protein
MKTITFFFTGLCLLLITSCTQLPVQSVSLMQQIKNEGQRMHALNLAYINLLFENKNAEVDSFMKKEYIPTFMSNVKTSISNPALRIDMNEKWPELFPKMIPIVNAVRDSLRTALVNNKNKLVGKLNADFDLYQQACDAQINLLSSASRLNKTKREIFNAAAAKLSGNKANLDSLEKKMDGILMNGNTIAQKILLLNEAVQTIIGNQ